MAFDDIRVHPDNQLLSLPETRAADAVASHPLDSQAAEQKLSQLKQWRIEARTIHAPNREQQAIDADFYDGLQWQAEDIEELIERFQAPLVFNLTAKYVNWLIGTERRTKVDWRVFPREDEDREAAEVKTKLLKYISDANKVPFVRSRAFEDAIKVGVGWLEDGIRSDPTDEPLFSRTESWRNLWWDPLAKELDLSDARFLVRERWTDLDLAIQMFPDRQGILEVSAEAARMFAGDPEGHDEEFSSWHPERGVYPHWAHGVSSVEDAFSVGLRRERVRLVETWYRTPTRRKVLRTGAMPYDIEERRMMQALAGQVFDPKDPMHAMAVKEGLASPYDALRLEVRCAIHCDSGLLQDMPSPYRHNKFPFTPIWCYRRDRDGMPYGVVRGLRDPQEDLNKRRSKALFILSTNQIIAEDQSVVDWDEVEEEAAKPNGRIRLNPGGKDKFEIRRDIELADSHIVLMQQNMEFMESVSGVTEENLGQETNAQSGRAILARQTQGGVVTAALFDNLRRAIQHQGEIQLSLVEQFYDAPKVVRLTNERGGMEFTRVNFPETDPETGLPVVRGSITESQADFIVDAQDFRESMRLAMAEQMLEMVGTLPPEVALQLLDLVVDLIDVPNKAEIVKRIRKINGQVDPDSPEAEQQEAAKDAQDAEQAAIEKQAVFTELAERMAKAEQGQAAAAKSKSEVLAKALEIAQLLAAMPGLAPAVDEIFKSMQSDEVGQNGQTSPTSASLPTGMIPSAGRAAGTPPPQDAAPLSTGMTPPAQGLVPPNF